MFDFDLKTEIYRTFTTFIFDSKAVSYMTFNMSDFYKAVNIIPIYRTFIMFDFNLMAVSYRTFI